MMGPGSDRTVPFGSVPQRTLPGSIPEVSPGRLARPMCTNPMISADRRHRGWGILTIGCGDDSMIGDIAHRFSMSVHTQSQRWITSECCRQRSPPSLTPFAMRSAKAPPPAFSGGGKWEAMRGDMAGIYEIRVSSAGANHRLFCLLIRAPEHLGDSSIVCLGGFTKPPRSAAHPREYVRIRQFADEFRTRRKVLE